MSLAFFKRFVRREDKKSANEAPAAAATTPPPPPPPPPPLLRGKSISRPPPLPVHSAITTAPSSSRLKWVPHPHAARETTRLLLFDGAVYSSVAAEADLVRLIARAAPDLDLDLGGLCPTARWLRGEAAAAVAAVDKLPPEQARARRRLLRLRLRDRAARAPRRSTTTTVTSATTSSSSVAAARRAPGSVVSAAMGDVSRAVLSGASLRAGTRVFVPQGGQAPVSALGIRGRERDYHRFRHGDEEEVRDDDHRGRGMVLAAGHLARLGRLPPPRGCDVEAGREEAKVGDEDDALWSDAGALTRLENSGHDNDEEEEEKEEEEDVMVYDPDLHVVKDVVAVISGCARLVEVLSPRPRRSPRNAERDECSAALPSPPLPATPCSTFPF